MNNKQRGACGVRPCDVSLKLMFKKILIANRGEIAVRVIRACRELEIRTVAVYSEADRGALHVRMADEAYAIGPAPSRESYLVIEKILDAAKRSHADAIHPGYGFLAENASFARACDDAGITFIGPSSASIALMGSKIEARRAVAQYGVEAVPGTLDPIRSDDQARKVAASVGYPIMLKASGGGGGKGLRFVASDEELESALRSTRSEALAAFGDDAIYIEKFVEKPRHIEIQVLADRHGNAVYLGERECTIQRRHQKVIEECPSPIVDADLRARMGQAALKVVQAADYFNAGTVEFLVDTHRRFYFLEMNTRLQVEHPVTEMVTGLDLVKLQIAIAAGVKLGLRQNDVVMRGAAIECRIYAEDPENNFFPSPGTIVRLRLPSGPGIRDDSGVHEGWTVPIEYDPLISKLAAWGLTREEAIARIERGLREYQIEGIKSNISFFLEILRQPDFRQGDFDTGFIDRWLKTRAAKPSLESSNRDLAAIAAALFHSERSAAVAEKPKANGSFWKVDARRRGLRSR
jgi:acetyl-CoA carboxylase biotin carboxylase subunit